MAVTLVAMASIDVQRTGPDTYTVSVSDDASSTDHVVTAVDTAAEARGVASESLVSASFRFVLDREPKESILSRFDLGVIGRYFPEYDAAIDSYLQGV